MIKVALAGNPNSGKTTLFNALTGATAHVGNWPGVTVEKRSGVYYDKGDKKKENGLEIVDLPGIYSLSPYTPEEVISRNFVLNEKPDVVVNIVDGTNLERNLYMTTQLLEMDVPLIVAINMIDAVKDAGQTIDPDKLSEELGVPVVLLSALRNKGIGDLVSAIRKASASKRGGRSIVDLPLVEKAAAIYREKGIESPLFHAVKALEQDEIEFKEYPEAANEAAALCKGEAYDALVADSRYRYLTPLVASSMTGRAKQEKAKMSRSDRIDRVLTHRVFGPIFLVLMMFLVFHLTFSEDLFFLGAMGVPFGQSWNGPFNDVFFAIGDDGVSIEGINSIGAMLANFTNGLTGMFTEWIVGLIDGSGAPGWVGGLVGDGVLGGVFAVIGFLPQILVLFAFMAILEDSGYMARAAFILDRLFRRFGVSGRAFIPMIMGFGCAVPAMINTRTLSTDKERTKTIRVIPFFTCGAKADFLIMIAAAVAAAINFDAGLFTFLIYFSGVVVAVGSVIVMNKTTQREQVPPFIMELPSYHRPQFRALMIHIWDKAKHFIIKAFTIILLSTIIVWFFSHFRWNWSFIEEEFAQDSILSSLGSFLSPLFVPLGFGNVQAGQYAWTFTVASIEGIIAKENVTAVMESLAGGLGFESFDALIAASGVSVAGLLGFTVFNLLTIPCFASVATAKGELLDKKTYWMTLLFWFGLSYVLGAVTYVVFEWVWTLAIVLPIAAAGVVGLIFYDRHKTKQERAALEEAA